MPLSKKIAIAASVIWVGLIWLLCSKNFLTGTYSGDEDFRMNAWVIGLVAIGAIYFLFRDNIDAKSEAHPDDLYAKLLEVNGCGPATAQRIMEKVQAGQELTDREQDFWNEVN